MNLLENTIRMFWLHGKPRAAGLNKHHNWKLPKQQHALPFED